MDNFLSVAPSLSFPISPHGDISHNGWRGGQGTISAMLSEKGKECCMNK